MREAVALDADLVGLRDKLTRWDAGTSGRPALEELADMQARCSRIFFSYVDICTTLLLSLGIFHMRAL